MVVVEVLVRDAGVMSAGRIEEAEDGAEQRAVDEVNRPHGGGGAVTARESVELKGIEPSASRVRF